MADPSIFPVDKSTTENEIFQLVKTSDLSQLTSAKVRQHLQDKFSLNFDDHKKTINEMTKKAIERMQKEKKKNVSEDSDSDHEKEKKKKSKESKKEKEEPKKEAKKEEKKEKEVKKEESSDSDSDHGLASVQRSKAKKSRKRKAEAEEFHDLASSVKSTRRAAATKAKLSIRKGAGFSANSKPKKEKDPNEDNSGKFGRMTKLCWISPELQEVTGGHQYMKRCDVVKELYAYCRLHDLFDPKNRQFVICDEKLEKVMKRKRYRAFGAQKLLVNHVVNPKDMGADIEEEADAEMKRLKDEWKKRQNGASSASSAPAEIVDSDDDDDDDEEPKEKKPKTEEEDEEDDEKNGGSEEKEETVKAEKKEEDEGPQLSESSSSSDEDED